MCVFPRTRDLMASLETKKKKKKTIFFLLFILHYISPVIFANTPVEAFVLFRNSRFSVHCYTQREPTPTQRSARKSRLPFATSCAKDYKGPSFVPTSFAELPNTDVDVLGDGVDLYR